jgi:dolichyl-phosphate beta-glucosyltransferase
VPDIAAFSDQASGTYDASDHSLSLVVPLYNEQERLRESGDSLGEFVARYGVGSELILVDDGSADATVKVAAELARRLAVPAQVVERPHLGKGAALRAGLTLACGTVQAFCDVDLAAPLHEMARVVAAAASAPVLAIASRDVVPTRALRSESEVRELLGKAFNCLLRLTLTPGIYDTQCGAKAAHREVWREILPYCAEDGFVWDAEAIAICRRRGMAVWEVGIAWSHDGRTRVRPVRDGVQMVASLPRIIGRVWHTPSLVVSEPARSSVSSSYDEMPNEGAGDGADGVAPGPWAVPAAMFSRSAD